MTSEGVDYSARRWLAATIGVSMRLLSRIKWHLDGRQMINGFRVVFLADSNPAAVVKLEAALALIDNVAPWRLSHLRRDISTFHLLDERSHFVYKGRAISLSQTTLEVESTEWLAAMIIYYATRARFAAHGVYLLPQTAMRILRSCFEASLCFAQRLPEGPWLVAHMTEQWDQGWWQKQRR